MAVGILDSRGGDLSKRANHGVYLCVDAGVSEYCVHIVAPIGVCGKYPWWYSYFDSAVFYSESKAGIFILV